MMDVEAARNQMIEQQVRAWEVLDPRVLAALARVRREQFVPEAYAQLAFADTAIPLGAGEHMLPPKVEGRILQALAPQPDDAVLEIGTGSGFFAACLAAMAGRVRTLEVREQLAARARACLKMAGIAGIAVDTADALTVKPEPVYDAVALTASLPVYDARFEGWLRPGGRLFVVVGTAPAMEARLVTKVAEQAVRHDSLFETVIDPLRGARAPDSFQF
jgi:protein-L-isoaspartate(D-aspartate) O-methyltransferase